MLFFMNQVKFKERFKLDLFAKLQVFVERINNSIGNGNEKT